MWAARLGTDLTRGCLVLASCAVAAWVGTVAAFRPASLNAAERAPDDAVGARITVSNGALSVHRPNGAEVLRYQLEPAKDSKLPVQSACYFHPFTTPAGVVVTDVAPADHPHHRGIFLAWVEMHGRKDADFWGWGEPAPTDGRKIVSKGPTFQKVTNNVATFTVVNEWQADGDPLVSEKLEAVVRPNEGEGKRANVLDLTYTLTPDADLTLARWAFSGFCVRTRGDAQDLKAIGPAGVVDLPNPSHVKPESDWPAARWYAYAFKLKGGKAAGVAVIDHPGNPKTLWHNHRDIKMLNPCIVAPGEVKLKANEPLVLRYRVVAFDGDAPVDLLNQLAGAWGEAKQAD